MEPNDFDPTALGALGDDEQDPEAGGDETDPTQDGDDNLDTEGGDEDDDQLPTDPAELRKLLLAERKRRDGLLQRTGRQADELGQWRAAFEQQLGGGQPVGGAPTLPQPGVQSGMAQGLPAPLPAAADPYQQAMTAAGAEYQALVNQGYDPNQAWAQYQSRLAQANQAEMQRQMSTFAGNLQTQQQQMARFEGAFLAAHPELEDPRARNLFGLYLQQAKSSGMFRNPVDAYEAAQKATVQYLTELGYEAVEKHESAKAKAKGLGSPGARGARGAGGPVNAEAAMAALNQAAASAHAASQHAIRSPGRPLPK